jgi:hypothetical protein
MQESKQYYNSSYDYELEWKSSLDGVKKFICENDRFPSITSYTYEENRIATWFQYQKRKYSPIVSKRRQVMLIPEICAIWEDLINKYPFLFSSNEDEEDWKSMMDQLKKFILYNGRLPMSKRDKNNENLRIWISHQQFNYSPVKIQRKSMLINNEISALWEELINEYPFLF